MGYCHACCTIGVVLRHCFWILFEFKLSGKVVSCCKSAQNCQQETAGNEPAIGVVLHHWRLFFSIRFEFQVVKDLAMIRDLMRRVCVTVTEIQT